MIFGARGKTVAFGLPGNPLAHFVSLNLFVRAAIDKLLGLPGRLSTRCGTLEVDLTETGNSRETLWPSKVDYSAGSATLTPLRRSSSGDLTCLAKADALARIPAGSRNLVKGAPVGLFSLEMLP